MTDTPQAEAQALADPQVDAQAPDEAQDDAQVTDEQAPEAVDVRDVRLGEAIDAGPSAGGQIGILLDVVVPISVRLGQAELPVQQLLQMGPGSVLTLDKRAGDPVDLFLRGIHFATGELVLVGDQLGVRIKDFLPAAS